MRKGLVGIIVAIAMLVVSVVPAFAAATTGMAYKSSTNEASATTAVYTFYFVTPNTIAAGGTIVIGFPAGFVISTITDTDVTETLGAGITAAWVVAGQNITGTTAGGTVATGVQHKVVIGATNTITNPSTAGSKTVSLTIGADSGSWSVKIAAKSTGATTTASVTIKSYIEFTITDNGGGGLDFGSLDPGTSDNPEAAQPTSAAVTCTVGSSTNKTVVIKLKGTDFSDGGTNSFAITNAKYKLDSSDPVSNIAMATSNATISGTSVTKGVGGSFGIYHWLNVPASQDPAAYTSTFTYTCE